VHLKRWTNILLTIGWVNY